MIIKRNRLARAWTTGLFIVAVLGGLAACNEDENTVTAETASEQPSKANIPDADDDQKNAALTASPTDCLVGTWLADNGKFGALLESALAGMDGGGTLSTPTGDVLVTFDVQGRYSVEYQNWTMGLSQQGVSMEMVRNGTDTGSYQADDDGALALTESSMGSTFTMKSPAGSFSIPSEPGTVKGTFVCDRTTLQINASDSVSSLTRQ